MSQKKTPGQIGCMVLICYFIFLSFAIKFWDVIWGRR